jgi:ubiquinone/menaquinone biosynthesis C-methylase UbiE
VSVNPFIDPANIAGYEAWYETTGHRADRLEKTLLRRLLTGFPRTRSMLEVGCGSGHFTRWLMAQNLQTVGLDFSPAMLAESVCLGGSLCVRGDALALPFPGNSFDLVALITTLEFVTAPVQALSEAARVARCGLILGVLNRQSLPGKQRKNQGGPLWDAAQFYTPAELAQLVHDATTGRQVKVEWWTTLWPLWSGNLSLPWGGFIGMAVRLN